MLQAKGLNPSGICAYMSKHDTLQWTVSVLGESPLGLKAGGRNSLTIGCF